MKRERKTANFFAGFDEMKEPIPVIPTVYYNIGGIPTNWRSEVVIFKDGETTMSFLR